MVYQCAQKLDGIFHALSDSTRRDILRRLSNENLSINKIAADYDMSLPGVSKHVKVLERAELIKIERLGRSFICIIRPGAFDEAEAQISFYKSFWTSQLVNFEQHILKKGQSQHE
jgi:DNA-binding transcriptional ArsR family regulator